MRTRPRVPRPRSPGAAALALASILSAAVAADPARAQDDRARHAGDDAALDQRIAQALERARPELLRALRRAEGGELALLCLAAAHDRVPTDQPVFADALRRLQRSSLHDTYGLSLRLLVAAQLEDFPDRRETAARDTAQLSNHQAREGGFSYSARPGHWDLSNTQYAALGLRAAVHLGQEVPRATFESLARATLRAGRDGGFGYTPGSAPTMSMTVAGIAILELCRQRLAPGSGTSGASDRELTTAIADAWSWLDARVATVGDLDAWHSMYAHYGLERAAILSARDTVGGEDWYRRGAAPMLRLQLRSGGFRNPQSSPAKTSAVDTAFAILFLRRSFQRELSRPGPTTPGPSPLSHQLPADASAETIDKAVALDVARGESAVPDLLRALRDPIRPRRLAAARAFLRISRIDFRYHPDRSDEDNAAALRVAEAWWAARSRDR
jgi:hypothetical protein